MKKHLTLLAAAFLMSAHAFADVQEAASLDESFVAAISGNAAKVDQKKGGSCSQVQTTDAQKTAMKAAFQQFEANRKSLEATAKAAHEAYFKLVADSTANYSAAEAAATSLSNATANLMSAKLAFKTQVLFQILTPTQRGPAIKCEMKHRRHRKHRGNRKPAPTQPTSPTAPTTGTTTSQQ